MGKIKISLHNEAGELDSFVFEAAEEELTAPKLADYLSTEWTILRPGDCIRIEEAE